MPKDEIDVEDPLELRGVVLPATDEADTLMAETFAEEFVRLGYEAERIVALCRCPGYLGPHRIWRLRGEAYVRDVVRYAMETWCVTAPEAPRSASPGASSNQIDVPPPSIPGQLA